MKRVTIEQFRAAVAGRPDQGPLLRAYRELARRPDLAVAAELPGWREWPEAPAGPAKS